MNSREWAEFQICQLIHRYSIKHLNDKIVFISTTTFPIINEKAITASPVIFTLTLIIEVILYKQSIVHIQLKDLHQSIFVNLKTLMKQVQWIMQTSIMFQLIDLWSRVKNDLDEFCVKILPFNELSIIVLLHYRIYLDSFCFLIA